MDLIGLELQLAYLLSAVTRTPDQDMHVAAGRQTLSHSGVPMQGQSQRGAARSPLGHLHAQHVHELRVLPVLVLLPRWLHAL